MIDPSPAHRLEDGAFDGDLGRLQEDQRLRWERGERVPVEDYLATLPRPPDAPEDVLDLIYHEILVREELGEHPGLDEYLRRFPQYAAALRDQFRVHEALRFIDPPPCDDAPSDGAAPYPSIPGFEVLGELGRGAVGVVYLARQAGLNRLVALKMILAGAFSRPQDRARFRDEAEIVARVAHPNLVQIYETGVYQGHPYFSMEYVDGGRLADALRGAPWPPENAARLVATLARAAHSAHERGVIHRDLTPSNVLLTAAGEPKIVDFGLAKLADGAARTATGEILGTPGYMAPEQATGQSKQVGPAADVYALGAILYELLTGRPPFVGASFLDTLAQVVRDEPISPCRLQPRIPRDLDTVCLKCLEKDPGRRYPAAAALADDLRRCLAGEPVCARPLSVAGRTVRWARRRPAVAALLAVSVLGALGAFALVVREGREARRAQAREARQRQSYQGLSAVLLRDRAARHCEQGEVARGLLWLADSLRMAPEDDGALRRALRADLAAWEGQLHPLLAVLEHPPEVHAAAWGPDGRLVITAGADGTARLWNAATGSPHGPPLHSPGAVSSVAFSPDGATILTVAGHEARLWKTVDGAPAVPEVLDLGSGGVLLAVAFHADGRRLFTATRRGPSAWLRSWRLDTGAANGPEIDLGPRINLVTFSPDGRFLVTGCEGPDIPSRIWRCDDGTPLRALKEHGDRVVAVAFHPRTGRLFATGSYDHTCRLWDGSSGEPMGVTFRHSDGIRAVALHPEREIVLGGGHDKVAQFWDYNGDTSLGPPMRHPDAVKVVRYSPDGQFALTASWDQVRLWHTESGEPSGAPLPHPREVVDASFSPDGRTVLTRTREGLVRLWSTAPARPEGRRLRHRGWVTAVAFHPITGRLFLTAIGGMEGKVLSWDAAAPDEPEVALGDLGPIFSLAYRADGRVFAAGTMQRKVWLGGEGARGAAGFPLTLDDWVWGVAFSPDGQTLVTGDAGGRARFWDAATGRERPGPLVHEKAVYAVAYSPDGRTVLTGSEDATARLWDAATHRPTGVVLAHRGSVYAVAFRPTDGRVIITGSDDRSARLWDAATGRPAGRPLMHPARVLAVAFSPDGRLVATGCGDGATYVWDAVTGHPIGRPMLHRGPVRAVAFGRGPTAASAEPAGWTLLSGSEDMTARTWDVPLPAANDSPERIMHQVQAATGMVLDAHGVPEALAPAAWRRLRREVD